MGDTALHALYKQTLLHEMTKTQFWDAYQNNDTIKNLRKEGKIKEANDEKDKLWNDIQQKVSEHPILKSDDQTGS